MLKKDLRKQYKQKRAQLTTAMIDDLSLDISNQLLQLDIWTHAYYHLFLPIRNQKEIDTQYIMSILHGKDKNIVIPKSDFETHTMQNFLLLDNTIIEINTYGIPEPKDGIEINTDKIDVVFIPLLAYDLAGNRVGYGKGFYDGFLSTCKKDVVKIGLSFFDPIEIIQDSWEKDIQLDYCCTPNKTYDFNNNQSQKPLKC